MFFDMFSRVLSYLAKYFLIFLNKVEKQSAKSSLIFNWRSVFKYFFQIFFSKF